MAAHKVETVIEEGQAKAVEWAKNLLANPGTWVILDTETTGLSAYDEVIQIAVLDSGGQVLLDTLIKPTCRITPGATAVHGITQETVADAPGFAEAYPGLLKALGNKKVIAYNVDFDKSFLNKACRQHDLPEIQNEWSCATLAYAKFYGDWNGRRSFDDSTKL